MKPNLDPHILYEDNHIIVVEKPVNMPTQADDSKDPDLLNMLKKYIKIRYEKPGDVYLGLVHRLDRPVGGAMVFARTSKAASRLSDAVRRRQFHKQYLAVTNGTPRPLMGSLSHFLVKDTSKNMSRVVNKNDPGAKDARLDYEVLHHTDQLALVRVNLHTGRPHQIRVQFAAIKCPLFGDQKYGASHSKPGQQLALWSHQIGFEHPVKKEWVEFTSDPPNEFPWEIWR